MAYQPDPGPTRQDRRRARNLIGIEYDPMISGIRRERSNTYRDYQRFLRDLNRDRRSTVREERAYGREGGANLEDIYNQLATQLEGTRSQVQQYGTAARGRVGTGYDESIAAAQGGTQQVSDALAEYAQKLGLQQAAPESLAGLQGELTKLGAKGAAEKSSELANLEALGAKQYGISTQAIDASRQESAQERANLIHEVQASIGKANQEYAQGRVELSRGTQDALIDIGARLSDALGSKGKALKEEILRVFEARSDRERAAYMDALQEEMQRAQLALDQQRMGLEERKFGYQKKMDAKALAEEEKEGDPWNRLQKWFDDKGFGPNVRAAAQQIIQDFPNPAQAIAAAANAAREYGGDPIALQKAVNVYYYGVGKGTDYPNQGFGPEGESRVRSSGTSTRAPSVSSSEPKSPSLSSQRKDIKQEIADLEVALSQATGRERVGLTNQIGQLKGTLRDLPRIGDLEKAWRDLQEYERTHRESYMTRPHSRLLGRYEELRKQFPNWMPTGQGGGARYFQ